jgi:hypothetical protein
MEAELEEVTKIKSRGARIYNLSDKSKSGTEDVHRGIEIRIKLLKYNQTGRIRQ